MTSAIEQSNQIQKLQSLIKDIEYGMLTTIDNGYLRSRPMATHKEIDADGILWFFTDVTSHKVAEVEQEHQVNVSYSAPDKQTYVSISGRAEVVRDRTKMQELWHPSLKAWFPQELDEPNIALLKITVEQAEYWDSPAGWVAKTLGFIKATATGERAGSGENAKINLQ
ncbi:MULTISPECIES: pyridoxamine 5'-phosphate oxidase family protein [unclassified Leptolyngbya]|uniref:pyridoxamine 5'-phosphate oxidase family protein n=1 Tax=unclassified Leptolyngbya TaxID=2650499 RepID=UPI001682ECEB|nr:MULTISPECIES: pyridoxamine 5'-phosphate oxidase family protein [unclassified Leptolyngbya]MBD1909795.1 pyridoxamine 5'-phosphate oxidase family protein [Leptolyngbya sp. FACHB-8]MBD2158946.1 pyridoxamine 5'-phosphate oxidase family protein [Leptolyngbya sp. FACHB-16]